MPFEPDHRKYNEEYLGRLIDEASKHEQELERIKRYMESTLKHLECEEHDMKSTGGWLQVSSDKCTKCGYEYYY